MSAYSDKYFIFAAGKKNKEVNMEKNQVIEQIKQVARKAVPTGGRLLLYGSQARGDAHEGSDWDLLIILDKPKIEQRDYDDVAFPFTYLGWGLGESIIPVIYTHEEWKRSSFLPFYKNVEQDKIVLI